ncbi:hypothetical protein HYV50_01635 [Candidatus Pacearchaeota archaeon]|nr:hypothetical protein [Candidatus Pacearchaeota archaeon]
MRKENLVVLKFEFNNCCVGVVGINEVKQDNFSMDLDRKTWSYQSWRDIPIGQRRSLYNTHADEIREGIIGVYDRTKIGHLNSMIAAATESTSERVSSDRYDYL